MGLFGNKKKKDEREPKWVEVDLLASNMSVRDYVLRILRDNPKTSGFIYLNEDAVPYAHGNLGEIIPPALYEYRVYRVETYTAPDETFWVKLYF